MDQNKAVTGLQTATEILLTYSLGILPQPGYTAIGQSSISFLMRDEWEVNRWAQAVDTTVREYDDDKGNHYWSLSFKHGEYWVYVQASKPIQHEDESSNAHLCQA